MTATEFEHRARMLRPQMLGVALAFFREREDAEDALQEAMIRLWTYCKEMDASRDIEALAVRVTKSSCVDLYRQQRRCTVGMSRIAVPLGKEPKAEGTPSPQEVLEAREAEEALNTALQKLSPRERELFGMRQLEDMTVDEISLSTGIAKASVKSMISMARKKLLTELKRIRQR